ncbi:RBL15, partial [Symbiodinium sp. KB8]
MSGEAPRTLQATRGGGVFNYLPFTTTFFMCACLGTFLLQFFLPDVASTGEFAITPGFIVFYFQWYRLISSAFFHGGLLHIGFNMMTLYALGTSLERQLGSLHMFVTSWIILLTSGFMYTAACMLLWAVTGAQGWLLYSAVGYSGVLFGMAVQESALSFLPTRSVFGCFNVPTKWYPWVLMVVLQLVMPNISLLGHLCGAVAGFLHIHGYLSWVTPSLDGVKAVEEAA